MRILCWLVFTLIFVTPALSAAVCAPEFPAERHSPVGWQGGDAVYSIPLKDGRDVWIFGDTLYGERRVVQGNEPRMVHNSLGISTCGADGSWHLRYVIRHSGTGKPASYFSPKDPQYWYWAMDGFEVRGELWVTLLCIAADPSQGAAGFKTCGSDLAHVTHLERDPQRWDVSIQTLVPDGVKAYPSATVVVDGDYAYLFALYEAGKHPLLATRVPVADLSVAADHLEYLAKDGSWKRGFVPADAYEVMPRGDTELSIRYHPERRQWLAVMFDPEPFSDRILLRTSPALTGPWTEGELIYKVPELAAGPKRDKDTFCYAAKEHPELEKSGQLLFTYVCNTMNIPSLATNLGIYFPQVVTVPISSR